MGTWLYTVKIDSRQYSVDLKSSSAANFKESFKPMDFLFLFLKSIVKLTSIENGNWFNIT